jgi:LysR family glycine cleavage system transcriptional activator
MKSTRNRISLRGLRTFCIVARRGSFRLAAEDLFLTPSAISHQIKSLESELDVKLFDRSARDLRVTVQPFFATEMLVPKLSRFISENPDIDINIDTEDQSAEKHPAQADVSGRKRNYGR